jgi:hypothetical protein
MKEECRLTDRPECLDVDDQSVWKVTNLIERKPSFSTTCLHWDDSCLYEILERQKFWMIFFKLISPNKNTLEKAGLRY